MIFLTHLPTKPIHLLLHLSQSQLMPPSECQMLLFGLYSENDEMQIELKRAEEVSDANIKT